MKTMKALTFDRLGDPREVLRLQEVEVPIPGEGEVLVRMLAASVNLGDELFIRGLYPEPKKPKLPGQVAGNHGAGVVERAPAGSGLENGSLVAFSWFDAWGERAAIPVERLIKLPSGYPLDKAAQFFNLVTAADILEQSGVEADGWLGINAAGSTVAFALAQLARAKGVRTLGVTRSADADPAPPVDRLLVATDDLLALEKEIGETTEGGLSGLADPVGDASTGAMIRSCAFGARVVLYGAMSQDGFPLSNADVLLRDLKIGGHTYRYFFDAPSERDAAFLSALAESTAGEDFALPPVHRVGLAEALHDSANNRKRVIILDSRGS